VETTSIDEEIRVGAVFNDRRVVPVWFMWHGRYYRVKTLTYTWHTDQGIAKIHHYSVSDGDNLYELQFNTDTLEWSLGKVSAG
jgi:hypothetical protein